MREHTTTVTGWRMYEKMDGIARAKKQLTATIEGCPYDINLEVVLNEKELYDMGFDLVHVPDDNIVYALEAHQCEKEMEVHSLMWLQINAVKMAMSQYVTHSWRLQDWDTHCPFLFDAKQTQHEEEVMQEERDTWE